MSDAVVPSAEKVNQSVVAHSNDGKSRLYVHHDEDVFPNYFQNGAGLDDFGDMEFDRILFEYDFRLHRESIQAVAEIGSSLRSFVPMVIYHRHVWWNYGYKLTLEEGEYFSLLLKSLGPTAHPEKEIPRGAVGNNSPRNQKPPFACNVQVIVGVKNNGIFENVVEGTGKLSFIPALTGRALSKEAATMKETDEGPLGSGYICNNLIKQSKLKELTDANEFVILRVSMNVDKNYFNIEELIEPVVPEISLPMSPENCDLLKGVLTLGKSPDSDFVFTRGSGSRNDATSYHVHQKILKQRSSMLESILREKFSLPTSQLLVVDNENRIIFPHLTDEDMIFLLTYLYTGEVILPKFDGFARVGRVLSLLVDRQQLADIFMQWQKLIVNNLTEVEKTNDDDVIVEECFKALLSVFSAPYGALPYAKRMALSLLADQITKSKEALVEKFGEQARYGKYQIGHFMESALKLKRFIASVKKMPYSL